jgi:hypothetical protein
MFFPSFIGKEMLGEGSKLCEFPVVLSYSSFRPLRWFGEMEVNLSAECVH